jgi:adenylylsulfate kinase-like enzyme
VNSVDAGEHCRDNPDHGLWRSGGVVIGDLIPVLWLCGPPGVGKSTVGWEIFAQLTEAGIEAGYVDIDQLGMCYPERASDPGRHRMKAQNLGAVVANYRAAGARCVIVSGVVDPGRGLHADMVPLASLTVCRLRVGRDELKQRFLGRGGQASMLEEALSEADAMDASDFAGVCVDISGLPVAEATRLVRERIGAWPRLTGPSRPREAGWDEGPATGADGPVLLLCGPTGVGKSTVGFEVYQRALRAGSTAAYVDLDQIGFCRPAPAGDPGNHRVKTRNLAAMWQTYRTAGAQCLIAVGPVENDAAAQAYAAALPRAAMTLCLLHAGADELTRRIMLRGQGGSWPQPGDPLAGQPTAYLLRVAASAAADAEALGHAVTGALPIDTGRLTVAEAADVIAAGTGWPRPAGQLR